MIFDLILTAFNLAVLIFVFYRLGRQKAYIYLLKAYERECKANEDARLAIFELQSKLRNSCDGKEEA